MKTKIMAFAICIIMVMTSLVSCSKTTAAIEPEDLKGHKVVVLTGSESVAIAKTYREDKGCKLTSVETPAELLSALTEGGFDCAILDKNIAEKFVKDNPQFCVSENKAGTGSVKFSTLDDKKVYTIMLEKALEALKADGTIDEIVNGYLTDPNYKYEFNEELEKKNGEFTIGVDAFFEPYSVNDDKEITGGINVAIVDAICTYLGCDYTILPVSTGSLANALRLGEADFVIGAIDSMDDIVSGSKLTDTNAVFDIDYVIVSKKG